MFDESLVFLVPISLVCFLFVAQSEDNVSVESGPRKIIIWKDRNRSVQLLNVRNVQTEF